MWLDHAFFVLCFVEITTAGFINTQFKNIQIGKPFTISWDPSTPSPVKINLLEIRVLAEQTGTDLVFTTLAAGIGNTFVWTPSELLKDNVTYTMQLVGGDNTAQNSEDFELVNRAALSASTSLPSASPATSSSIISPTLFPSQTSASSLSPSQISTPSTISTSATQSNLNIRIAILLTIITLLILIVVALIFYERGKRAAAQKYHVESSYGSSFSEIERGDGSDGLKLVEGFQAEDRVGRVVESANCERCIVVGIEDVGREVQEDGQVEVLNEAEETKKRKMKSMRSIYELG